MTTPTPTPTPATGRRQRLRIATRDIHARLDQRITRFQPFADRGRYTAFLLTQYRLHRDAEALFDDPALNACLPHLRERSRLALIEHDLRDLGVDPRMEALPAPAYPAGADMALPTALGWLYTVEGSNIGAAFLLKAAAALGLHGGFGARHLAPHADGRAAHWRDFIVQLDEIELDAAQEDQVDAGAQAAFGAALAHAEHCMSEMAA